MTAQSGGGIRLISNALRVTLGYHLSERFVARGKTESTIAQRVAAAYVCVLIIAFTQTAAAAERFGGKENGREGFGRASK